MEIDEDTKKRLLGVISEVETVLPKVKEMIEKGELSSAYEGVFWTLLMKSPTGAIFNSIELTTTRRATFSILGDCEGS